MLLCWGPKYLKNKKGYMKSKEKRKTHHTAVPHLLTTRTSKTDGGFNVPQGYVIILKIVKVLKNVTCWYSSSVRASIGPSPLSCVVVLLSGDRRRPITVSVSSSVKTRTYNQWWYWIHKNRNNSNMIWASLFFILSLTLKIVSVVKLD